MVLILALMGCGGGPTVEKPKDTVAAPEKAYGVGAGDPGKEGGKLPVPPPR
jgi:hypothetical protein